MQTTNMAMGQSNINIVASDNDAFVLYLTIFLKGKDLPQTPAYQQPTRKMLVATTFSEVWDALKENLPLLCEPCSKK